MIKKKKRLLTGVKIIDDNKELWKLNEKIQNLYSSYFKINYNDEPVYFDVEQEKKDKYKMLSLINQLICYLDELNDGSYFVDDRKTERIKNL